MNFKGQINHHILESYFTMKFANSENMLVTCLDIKKIQKPLYVKGSIISIRKIMKQRQITILIIFLSLSQYTFGQENYRERFTTYCSTHDTIAQREVLEE